MFPKEHGAYGQLLFPIVTALAVGRPGAAAMLLAVAAACAFLAHEPLLVLLGQRGGRAARDQSRRATVWFVGSAALSVVAGVSAFALASSAARVLFAVPAVFAVAVLGVILAQREHTLFGEALSSIALSSIALPIARAAGAPIDVALACAATFAAAFVSGTLCVRAVIAATKRPPAAGTRLTAAAVAAGSLVALQLLTLAGIAPGVAPWAAAPVCAGGLVLVCVPPPTRHLRTVGWALVAGTTATAAILVAILR